MAVPASRPKAFPVGMVLMGFGINGALAKSVFGKLISSFLVWQAAMQITATNSKIDL